MSSTSTKFASLEAAFRSEEFAEVDIALRRGRHIDRDDTVWFGFLVDAQDVLGEFYARYGCELVQRSDGYSFLLPSGDKLRKKHLSTGAMLVGQALALLYLDPATAGAGGRVSRDELLAQLDGVVGTDALIRCFNPKRRRYDERVAQETVRKKVAGEVRRLASLGFVELAEAEQIRLRPALMRFAEPVRGLADPAEALAKLVASGEATLTEEPALDADEERAEDRAEVLSEEASDDAFGDDAPYEDASDDEPSGDEPSDGEPSDEDASDDEPEAEPVAETDEPDSDLRKDDSGDKAEDQNTTYLAEDGEDEEE